jgi:transcription termination/antitermination protein NusA
MQVNFLAAINQIAEEKNLPREIIIETVEAALAAAYRKDYGDKDQEVRVSLDNENGEIHVLVSKQVVQADEDVENEFLQMSLAAAKKIDKKATVGTEEEPYMVEYEEHPEDFGRVAAQTAKQVIIQRLREAEREIVFTEYKDKEDTLLNGNVQRIEGNTVYIDLGKATGVMFGGEQIPGERYFTGQRVKVYVIRVEQTTRGPQIVVSRSHANVVRHLFALEVPEIETGAVEIKALAREAGVRSKVAVASNADGVDAVGTFVGGRGSRVQAVMSELGEEKIDIILYNADPATFITNALSPTKVVAVQLREDDKKAIVRVPEDQLSLAIGKQGQNVRLAAKLTGWNIDIINADVDSGHGESETGTLEAQSKPRGKKDLESSLIDAVNAGTAETEPESPSESVDDLSQSESPVDPHLEPEQEAQLEQATDATADATSKETNPK